MPRLDLVDPWFSVRSRILVPYEKSEREAPPVATRRAVMRTRGRYGARFGQQTIVTSSEDTTFCRGHSF